MTAITIRKLPESAKQSLRMRAASNGRSMEAEERSILLDALADSGRAEITWIEQLIAVGVEVGGVDLPDGPEEPAPSADLSGVR